MAATIRDVAKLAGVSISTVSRVFNNKEIVSTEVRDRVMLAAKKCNYTSNFFAKGLRSGRSKTIAFIVPNIENPMYPPLLRGAESYANSLDYGVLQCNTNEDPALESTYIDNLSNRMVEGFLITPTNEGGKKIAQLQDKGIPVVCVSRCLKDETVNQVGIDHKKAGYDATKYLVDQGHKKIVMLSSNVSYVYKLRESGYRRALAEAGIEYRPEMVFMIDSVDVKECAFEVEKIFRGNPLPDAMFCGSDPKAIGAIHALKKMGYSIPKDTSIISIDDLFPSEFINPPLTTLRQPFHDIGMAAAEMLIDIIENQKNKIKATTVQIHPTTLMIRGSTKGDEAELAKAGNKR